MQKILILYTGGTIGMEQLDGVYYPTSGFESLARRTIAPAIWEQMPAHDYLESSPVIDSADMTPDYWLKIAKIIIEKYDHYAGFIVLHGTDTMAYSASMLSFLLGKLDKTIIFTGSQIPLVEPCSDGANNLLISLQLVAKTQLPEVCVFFANQLFRGNRSTKISTSAMVAFESTNYPNLGVFENQLKLFKKNWLISGAPKFDLPSFSDSQVVVIYLTPGMSACLVRAAIAEKVRGLVVVSYGAGNVPAVNQELMASFREANRCGIVMVNVSQCAGGHVRTCYATSKPLQEAGVISGEDMTIEAAFTKLYYLLAKYPENVEIVKSKLSIPLRGELTRC